MPMDIRNFFAKRPGGDNSNDGTRGFPPPETAASGDDPKKNPPEKKDTSKSKRATSASLASNVAGAVAKRHVGSAVTSDTSRATGRAAPKPGKSGCNNDDDDDDDDDEIQTVGYKRSASARKRKVIRVDDDVDDHDDHGDDREEEGGDKMDTAGNAREVPITASKSPAKKSKADPSSKAANRKESSTAPRKIVRKRIRDNNDDDDDDDGVTGSDFADDGDDDDYKDDGAEDDRSDDEVLGSTSVGNLKSRSRGSSPRKRTPVKTPSPAKRPRNLTPISAAKSSSTKKSNSASAAAVLLDPSLVELDSFDVDSVRVPECLAGLTFVLTGVLDNLARDEAQDIIKTLGGRVTTAVSGKTSYLVVGQVLEDGRPYQEGSKYKKATSGNLQDKIKIVMGERQLYGLCRQYHQNAMKEKGISFEDAKPPGKTTSSIPTSARKESTTSPVTNNSYVQKPAATFDSATTKTTVAANPYAKSASPVSNPYLKKANPYMKSAPASSSPVSGNNPYAKPANPYAKSVAASSTYPDMSTASGSTGKGSNTKNMNNSLWVDRYAPTDTSQILGNKNHVKKLQDWLCTWEKVFNNPKNASKTFSNPKGPWKAALLSGPPGIGKTTTATLVAKEAGRDVLEFNASDARSKKALQETMGDLTGSQTISFLGSSNTNSKRKIAPQKRCVIMDEVDGMGAGDRSGMAELIQMIKKSKIPIICICNDRQSQKMKSLLPYCMDLRFSRPTKHILANRAIRVAELEGMHVERNAAEAIAESCGNDVRQVLNLLQMWAQKKNQDGEDSKSAALTYKGLKDRERNVQKDEILRISLFDAAKSIMEGRQGLQQADAKANVNSLFMRSDAFFVDYSMVGMIVEQNYPRVIQNQFLRIKQKGDAQAEQALLERMHQAAESMSEYNLVENQIRGGDLNWSLLPIAAMLTVKCGYHAGGEQGGFLGGFPEFTAWMGKNSTMGKNYRLLHELNYHISQKVSAHSQELRQTYIPVMRERILKLLKNGDADSIKGVIELMDEYGLSREDIAEKLDVFVLGKKEDSFDDMDSKQKAAFTREYNAGSHRSQALVREQGGANKAKQKGKTTKEKDPNDLDAIDEDGVEEEEDDEEGEDEEKELKKLQDQFKKKGRKKSATETKAAPKKSRSKN